MAGREGKQFPVTKQKELLLYPAAAILSQYYYWK